MNKIELIKKINDFMNDLPQEKIELIYRGIFQMVNKDVVLKKQQLYNQKRMERHRLWNIIIHGNYSPQIINLMKEKYNKLGEELILLRKELGYND